MSRAKKTKRAKEYSRIHLYRHFEELSNHAKNVLSQQDIRSTPAPPQSNQEYATPKQSKDVDSSQDDGENVSPEIRELVNENFEKLLWTDPPTHSSLREQIENLVYPWTVDRRGARLASEKIMALVASYIEIADVDATLKVLENLHQRFLEEVDGNYSVEIAQQNLVSRVGIAIDELRAQKAVLEEK